MLQAPINPAKKAFSPGALYGKPPVKPVPIPQKPPATPAVKPPPIVAPKQPVLPGGSAPSLNKAPIMPPGSSPVKPPAVNPDFNKQSDAIALATGAPSLSATGGQTYTPGGSYSTGQPMTAGGRAQSFVAPEAGEVTIDPSKYAQLGFNQTASSPETQFYKHSIIDGKIYRAYSPHGYVESKIDPAVAEKFRAAGIGVAGSDYDAAKSAGGANFGPSGTTGAAATTASPAASSASIPFKPGLSPVQQQSIQSLAQKPSSSWNDTDKANWNYATNNAPLPGQSGVSAPSSPTGITGGLSGTTTSTDPYLQQLEALRASIKGTGTATSEELQAQTEYDKLRAQKKQALADIGADPDKVTGVKQGLANVLTQQYAAQEEPLQTRIAREQAKRQASLDVAGKELEITKTAQEYKTAQEQAKLGEKGIEVSGSIIDPRTGRVIYAAPAKPAALTEVSPGATLYDPSTGKSVFTAPKDTSGSDGDRVLSATEAQALGVPFGTTALQAYGRSPTGKPTVDESKARQFAVAAENANNVLSTIGYDPGVIENPWMPNVLKGAQRQQFEQAARAFVNATLRRESGATITDSEFTNKYKELIDQAGDSIEVKAQKAAARLAAVKSIQEAGRTGEQYSTGGDELDRVLDSLGFNKLGSDSQNALKTLTIGKREVRVAAPIALRLARAAEDFKEATGRDLEINQDFRTHEEQTRLYNELSKKGARVAPPGQSFHERGLAIDVTNWQEAQPFLRKYGLVNDLPDDRGHFSFGETRKTA